LPVLGKIFSNNDSHLCYENHFVDVLCLNFFLNTDIVYGCHNSLLISDFILGTRIFGRKMAAVTVQRAGANLASGCCLREGGAL
jgi:hypothetical protein